MSPTPACARKAIGILVLAVGCSATGAELPPRDAVARAPKPAVVAEDEPEQEEEASTAPSVPDGDAVKPEPPVSVPPPPAEPPPGTPQCAAYRERQERKKREWEEKVAWASKNCKQRKKTITEPEVEVVQYTGGGPRYTDCAGDDACNEIASGIDKATGGDGKGDRGQTAGMIRNTGRTVTRAIEQMVCPSTTPEHIVDAFDVQEERGRWVGSWPPKPEPSRSPNGQVAMDINPCNVIRSRTGTSVFNATRR